MNQKIGILRMEIKTILVLVEHGNIFKIKKFRLYVENFFPINQNLKIKLGPSLLNLELVSNL